MISTKLLKKKKNELTNKQNQTIIELLSSQVPTELVLGKARHLPAYQPNLFDTIYFIDLA